MICAIYQKMYADQSGNHRLLLSENKIRPNFLHMCTKSLNCLSSKLNCVPQNDANALLVSGRMCIGILQGRGQNCESYTGDFESQRKMKMGFRLEKLTLEKLRLEKLT